MILIQRGDRPSFERYFAMIAEVIALRSDCMRSKVGCVLVREDHSIAGTGYNGYSAGKPGCAQGACPRGRLGYAELPMDAPYSGRGACGAKHAEENALRLSCRDPQNVVAAFVTREPCMDCAEMLFLDSMCQRIIWPGGELLADEWLSVAWPSHENLLKIVRETRKTR